MEKEYVVGVDIGGRFDCNAEFRAGPCVDFRVVPEHADPSACCRDDGAQCLVLLGVATRENLADIGVKPADFADFCPLAELTHVFLRHAPGREQAVVERLEPDDVLEVAQAVYIAAADTVVAIAVAQVDRENFEQLGF